MPIYMNDAAFTKKGYQITNEKSTLDFDVIYNYLAYESYWAKGITADRLQRAIDNSLCFGVYHNYKLVGFARVVTDMATFAYLCDVFVLAAHRGVGLSKWMVQTIVAYPELQGVRRWSLATADAQGLYSQFGFTPIDKPEVWMQIFTPYKKD